MAFALPRLEFQQSGNNGNKKEHLVVLGVVWIILMWVLTIFSTAANDSSNAFEVRETFRQQADIANFFLWLLSTGIGALIIAGKVNLISFASLGTKSEIFKAVLIGGGAALAAFAIGIFVKPLSIVGLVPFLQFFYVVIVSAIAEETFFRGFLPSTIHLWTRNWYLAILVPALLFAAFHFYVDQSNPQLFAAHFMFAIVATLLNLYTGSVAGSYVYHIVNNALYL